MKKTFGVLALIIAGGVGFIAAWAFCNGWVGKLFSKKTV